MASNGEETELTIDVKKYEQENNPRKRVRYFLKDFDDLLKRLEIEKRQPGYTGDFRPERRALTALGKYRNLVNGSNSIYGPVPGVNKGDAFTYRAQMSLICLHRPNHAGIDCVTVNETEFSGNAGLAKCSPNKHGISIAVSVVVSDRESRSEYGNKLGLNEILYEGHGGYHDSANPTMLRDEDQKPVRGNLALKHCYHLSCPVRVIRTNDEGLFQYDGFYDVKNCTKVPGPNSLEVYRFHLVRRARGIFELEKV